MNIVGTDTDTQRCDARKLMTNERTKPNLPILFYLQRFVSSSTIHHIVCTLYMVALEMVVRRQILDLLSSLNTYAISGSETENERKREIVPFASVFFSLKLSSIKWKCL